MLYARESALHMKVFAFEKIQHSGVCLMWTWKGFANDGENKFEVFVLCVLNEYCPFETNWLFCVSCWTCCSYENRLVDREEGVNGIETGY